MPTHTGNILLKSVQNSPFFHAHLQKGSDSVHEDDSVTVNTSHDDDMWEEEDGIADSSPPVEIYDPERFVLDEHEWTPRASPLHHPLGDPIHRSTPNLLHLTDHSSSSSNSALSRPSPSKPMPPDQDITDYFATQIDTSPESLNPDRGARKYHYLTRSQSAATYPPKPRTQQTFYNPGYASSLYHIAPSPLRTECDPREPDVASSSNERSTNPFSLTPHRNLEPIEERDFFTSERHQTPSYRQRNQGDNASLHSNFSTHSSLFINRPVNSSRMRQSTSTSTIASSASLPNRVSPTAPSEHSPSSPAAPSTLTRKLARSFSTLPIIPASPRVSQNVVQQPAPLYAYPPAAPTPQPFDPTAVEFGATYGEFPRPPPSVHTKTPSLLSRSESVRTELTYLTAPDSIRSGQPSPVGTRHAAADARRLSGLDERLAGLTATTTRGGISHPADPSPKTPDTYKSQKWASRTRAKERLAALRVLLPSAASGKWVDAQPAELLFWLGFIGPWCWLIGGWMLTRRGSTAPDGRRMRTSRRRTSRRDTAGSVLPMWHDDAIPLERTKSTAKSLRSVWDKVKASSLETITSVRSVRSRSQGTRSATTLKLPENAALAGTATIALLDPWVSRCRVAAVVSGLLILVASIIALIALGHVL